MYEVADRDLGQEIFVEVSVADVINTEQEFGVLSRNTNRGYLVRTALCEEP